MVKITPKGKKSWVTFSFTPKEDEDVVLCGSWNKWKSEAMKMKKSGEFSLRRLLDANAQYEFGYRVNGAWHCDDELECVTSPFGSQNSLLKL